MRSLPRLCFACLLAALTILDLSEFFAEWEERWKAVVALLELWYVRLILIVAAGILITYPQWVPVLRTRMRLPWESTFWGGIVFTLAWERTKWVERWKQWRERRKQKKRGGRK